MAVGINVTVGVTDGSKEGATEIEGAFDGMLDGTNDIVGDVDGALVGVLEGKAEGPRDNNEGELVGGSEGTVERLGVGPGVSGMVGRTDGWSLPTSSSLVGTRLGASDATRIFETVG